MSADTFLGESVLCKLRIFTTTIITNSLFVYVTSTAAHQDQHLINKMCNPFWLPQWSDTAKYFKITGLKMSNKAIFTHKAHFLCLHIYPIPTVNTRPAGALSCYYSSNKLLLPTSTAVGPSAGHAFKGDTVARSGFIPPC